MRFFCLLVLSLLLVACSGRVEPKGVLGGKLNPSSPANQQNACSGTELSARIVNPIPDDQFRVLVADLVSATLEPSQVGNISGSGSGATGVDLLMNLKFSSNHSIDSNSSQFRLIIRDSYVGQIGFDAQKIEPIEIVHGGGSQLTGSYDPNTRNLAVTFTDEYGTIQVYGQIQNDALVGTVSFNNFVSWDGGAAKSGTLGSIQAQSCSFQ